GHFAGTFNGMAANLSQALKELEVAHSELAERHADLEQRDTDLLAMNTQLVESERRALAANEAKTAFLANMSHELRTPLNAIIGYSEMLQEEADDLGQADLVPDLIRIHAAGKHLLLLINDILDLSKIEAGKMDLFLETFDVQQTAREVVATIRPLAEKNGNTAEVKIDGSGQAMHADVTKARQAPFN